MSKLILKDKNGKQVEFLKKDEFDGKVNTTNALHQTKFKPYNLYDALSEYGNQTLGAIHNSFRSIDNQSLIGNFDSLLVFGGNDVKHAIDIGTFEKRVRISTKTNGSVWQEDLVLKSDYDRLYDRVCALEKKVWRDN